MKIIITGGNGQLGSDLLKKACSSGHNAIGIGIDDLDLTDEKKVSDYFDKEQPDAIIHTAAYTAVDSAEDNEEQCYKVNVLATRYVVRAASLVGAKFLYVSTDYVFDGQKNGEYEITDLPNPQSVYGKTKYLGELEAMQWIKSFIVRISWVFGINGKNFVKTMIDISKKNNEINVVSDQIGSPTYTKDISGLFINMVESNKYGIYHATNEGFTSWADFAKTIFRIKNIGVSVNEIKSIDYKTKAVRPMNSRLSKKSLDENGFSRLPDWQDALKRFLKELGI